MYFLDVVNVWFDTYSGLTSYEGTPYCPFPNDTTDILSNVIVKHKVLFPRRFINQTSHTYCTLQRMYSL